MQAGKSRLQLNESGRKIGSGGHCHVTIPDDASHWTKVCCCGNNELLSPSTDQVFSYSKSGCRLPPTGQGQAQPPSPARASNLGPYPGDVMLYLESVIA
ncbi:hypothetical protein J6590_062660 [Homalodisca vitripennis]|nr:hypothetical protein J6590_062660 [Homalodisca vitripennis]